MVFIQWLNSYRILQRLARALIRLRVYAGWSEALLVAHTTLLEISCTGSYNTASGLGLHCLPVCMSQKNDARHVWVYLRAMFSDNGRGISDCWFMEPNRNHLEWQLMNINFILSDTDSDREMWALQVILRSLTFSVKIPTEVRKISILLPKILVCNWSHPTTNRYSIEYHFSWNWYRL